MAGPAPNTKLWTARENEHQPSGLHLIVGGQVEVSDVNKAPVLTEALGVGKVLGLDLTIVDTGEPGIQTPVWKAAPFHKEVSANQYNSVAIRWDGKTIATTPVIDDTEHDKLTDKQAELQNKKYGTTPRQKAKKVATTVKTAVKQAAKKAKKKVARKTAKKPAAKSVRKTVKKLVSKLVKTLKGKPAKKAKNKAKKKAKGGKKGRKR